MVLSASRRCSPSRCPRCLPALLSTPPAKSQFSSPPALMVQWKYSKNTSLEVFEVPSGSNYLIYIYLCFLAFFTLVFLDFLALITNLWFILVFQSWPLLLYCTWVFYQHCRFGRCLKMETFFFNRASQHSIPSSAEGNKRAHRSGCQGIPVCCRVAKVCQSDLCRWHRALQTRALRTKTRKNGKKE